MIAQAVKDVYFMLARWATLPNYQFTRARYRAFGKTSGLLVHLGCGDDYIPGMINVDGNFARKKELWLDLRNPLPFATGSASLVYCSHMLEHLYPEEAMKLLGEIRRVLAADGVARIAVPSFEHALEIAAGDGASRWPRAFDDPLGQAINWLFCDGQHKYAYSWGVMQAFARGAGFQNVTRSSPESATRVGGVEVGREVPGSLVVELRLNASSHASD